MRDVQVGGDRLMALILATIVVTTVLVATLTCSARVSLWWHHLWR